MGMSIDEAHGILSNGLVNAPSEHEWCVAFKTALNTMRKYQKIQDIVSSKTTRLSYEDGFRQIKEVLEDGNDD